MHQIRVDIAAEADVSIAISQIRRFLTQQSIRSEDVYRLTTVVAELARNIVKYARLGAVQVSLTERLGRLEGCVIAEDEGPGIDNVEAALADGFTTGGTLGMGLPGCRRMMDTFSIDSVVGRGTIIKTTRRLGRA